MGLLLWQTSNEVIAQSRQTVVQGEQVVERGRDVLNESQKVSEVVKMSIVKDPIYSDNPALLDAFKGDSEKQAERMLQQQRTLEQQALELKQRAAGLAHQQRAMLWTLTSVLGLLVVLLALAGIVVTHKIAGPIYKMKRQIREVSAGKLRIPAPLRKGDDLVDFFDAFALMVDNLRSRQQQEIARLEEGLNAISSTCGEAELRPIRELLRDMKATLED